MTKTITCPSGLSGQLRGMKVREERILTDRNLSKHGGQMDALLATCWEETHDPGPYRLQNRVNATQPADQAASLDWGEVLQGDRFYALLQLRVTTYGPEYAFRVTCSEASCRASIDWELDLRELPVRALSSESRARFLDGNRFETTLPSTGAKIWFKLLTGDDERKLTKLRRQAQGTGTLLSSLLAFRVVEIEGVAAQKSMEKRRFLEELPMRDVSLLLSAMDAVDCGVETSIEIECPECFAVQEVELPFERDFFLPNPSRTARHKNQHNSQHKNTHNKPDPHPAPACSSPSSTLSNSASGSSTSAGDSTAALGLGSP